jgi:hypothetical protein
MMGIMDHPDGENPLDELYAASPEEFTVLRGTLAAAAKKRGDTATAKLLSAARKPTTAAWVVNHLVRENTETRDRLRDLADQLRTAHADMDGERIRALSAEQRLLVDHLTRTAFTAAALQNPSTALRDDVTATLQAAIADPDVAARLGRLVKAERWSGFGFGESAAVSSAARKVAPKPPPAAPPTKTPKPAHDAGAEDRTTRRRELGTARAAMAEARRAKAENDQTLLTRHQELAAAKVRHQDALRALHNAERLLQDAEAAYTDAEQAGVDAAARIATLRARLDELRG